MTHNFCISRDDLGLIFCVFMSSAVKSATSKSPEDFDGLFKPAKALKQGSVLDLLKAPGRNY